jgi:hypothetical protein
MFRGAALGNCCFQVMFGAMCHWVAFVGKPETSCIAKDRMTVLFRTLTGVKTSTVTSKNIAYKSTECTAFIAILCCLIQEQYF